MTKVTVLDWGYPVGRNEKGQFVSLKNVKCNGGVDPEPGTDATTTPATETVETPAPEATPEVAPTAEAKVEKPVAEKKPKVVKPKGPVIEITEAIYGAEEKTANVTASVKVGRKVTNKNLGGVDPAPKQKKTLSVKALIDGSPIEKVFTEGEKLVF